MDDEKRNKSAFLSTPERQSPIAIVLILFRFVRLIARQLWPFIVIFLFNPSRTSDSWWTIGFAVIGSVSALLSIVAYFKFYYYIKGDELVIEKGLFRKKKLNVPFNRIQTINFNQNIIHRFFNVVALEIDTAGSKGNEFSINALGKEKAERIRTYLLSQKKEILIETDFKDIAQEIPVYREPDKLLLKLDIGDLIKIGLGQNHIRSIGIISGTLFGWVQLAEDVLGKKAYQAYQLKYYDLVLQFFTSVALFILILAFLITLISTVIRFYDLRFYQTYQGFKIQTGLFNRKENSAKMSKIQFVRWTNNPVKKLFHLYNLQLFQAASSAVSRKQSILVPGCYKQQIQVVRSAYFPSESSYDYESHVISPRIIIKLTNIYGLLPAAIYLISRGSFDWVYMAYAIGWILLIVILSTIYHRKWQFSINLEGLLIKKGLFNTSFTSLKWFKIQSIQIRQSFFQRRRNLTTLHIYTAAGALQIPYIDVVKARQLQNYILYKIESSSESWM